MCNVAHRKEQNEERSGVPVSGGVNGLVFLEQARGFLVLCDFGVIVDCLKERLYFGFLREFAAFSSLCPCCYMEKGHPMGRGGTKMNAESRGREKKEQHTLTQHQAAKKEQRE